MVNWVKRLPVSQNQPSNHKTNIGKIGENIAAVFLSRKGYRVVSRNFRARYGELDIVALEGDTLVFVEVKPVSGTGSVRRKKP